MANICYISLLINLIAYVKIINTNYISKHEMIDPEFDIP